MKNMHAWITFPHFFMNYLYLKTRSIEFEMLIDHLRLKAARTRAEELIRDYSWTDEDSDFEIQVEKEARRQWNKEMDREREEQMLVHDELFLDLIDETQSK